MFNTNLFTIKSVFKGLALAASSVFFLAGCDSNDNDPLASSKLRVVHASPDAPKVQLSLNGALFNSGAMYDYGQATAHERRSPGVDALAVEAILPGGTSVTVIGPVDLSIEPDTNYDVFAIGSVGSETLEPFVMSRSDTFDKSQVRISVAHLAEGVPMVDVYATAPGADLEMVSPTGSFSYTETLGPLVVPAGDYQIRVTLTGMKEAVYDSGTLGLPAGADFTIAAVNNTSATTANATSKSPVSLLIVNGDSISTAYSLGDGAELRVGHNSADAPAVDIVVNNNTDMPLVEDLSFPDFTGYVSVPAADYNVKVLEANSTDADEAVINADLSLQNGTIYSVIALNEFAEIEPLVLVDNPRRIATEAKLRVVHGSSLAGEVDIYLTEEGADISAIDPALSNIPFKADSGYLSVAEGTYDVTVTATGSKDAAIEPATIMLSSGGVYTIVARDELDLMGVGVTLLDDFLANQ